MGLGSAVAPGLGTLPRASAAVLWRRWAALSLMLAPLRPLLVLMGRAAAGVVVTSVGRWGFLGALALLGANRGRAPKSARTPARRCSGMLTVAMVPEVVSWPLVVAVVPWRRWAAPGLLELTLLRPLLGLVGRLCPLPVVLGVVRVPSVVPFVVLLF